MNIDKPWPRTAPIKLILYILPYIFLASVSPCRAWDTVIDYSSQKPEESARDTFQTPAAEASLDTLEQADSTIQQKLLNCLCGCVLPGTNFSCSYDTTSPGWSPSCRKLDNGPCFCVAYGCVRKPLPEESDCTRKCKEEHTPPQPELCADEPSTAVSAIDNCIPQLPPHWLDSRYSWEVSKYSDQTRNMQEFNFCYDSLFSLLHQTIPAKPRNSESDKKNLFINLLQEGYEIVASRLQAQTPDDLWKEEVDASTIQTQRGDVVLLGFFSLVPRQFSQAEQLQHPELNGKNYYLAPHYMIMENSTYFYQILNNDTGYIDKARPLQWLFNKRDLGFLSRLNVDPDKKIGKPYKTYIILRKK